jgi:hypothetical protein
MVTVTVKPNNGDIAICTESDTINVELKKKRDLPFIIELMKNFDYTVYTWLGNKKVKFIPVASS